MPLPARLARPRAVAAALGLWLLAAPAALAVGVAEGRINDNPDYVQAVRLIEAQNYRAAIDILMRVRLENPAEPAVSNWLGFAWRKLKDYPTSRRFYDEALSLDPNFLPALEYQGEWFIETGDMASAKANLEKLRTLCGRCHEYEDLERAIARAAGR